MLASCGWGCSDAQKKDFKPRVGSAVRERLRLQMRLSKFSALATDGWIMNHSSLCCPQDRNDVKYEERMERAKSNKSLTKHAPFTTAFSAQRKSCSVGWCEPFHDVHSPSFQAQLLHLSDQTRMSLLAACAQIFDVLAAV
eukprot:6205139-Pleurochrysis_carterae.AAC.3